MVPLLGLRRANAIALQDDPQLVAELLRVKEAFCMVFVMRDSQKAYKPLAISVAGSMRPLCLKTALAFAERVMPLWERDSASLALVLVVKFADPRRSQCEPLTSPGPPRLAMASVLRRASPSGTAPLRPGQPGPLAERVPVQRRTPADSVSMRYLSRARPQQPTRLWLPTNFLASHKNGFSKL